MSNNTTQNTSTESSEKSHYEIYEDSKLRVLAGTMGLVMLFSGDTVNNSIGLSVAYMSFFPELGKAMSWVGNTFFSSQNSDDSPSESFAAKMEGFGK